MLEPLYETLHSANILLSLPKFLKVVSGLIGSSDPLIRKRVLSILDERIKAIANNFEDLISSDFNAVLDMLVNLLKSEKKELENVQLCLLAISTMARTMGAQDPERYFSVLETVMGNSGLQNANRAVVATALATTSVLVSKLDVRVIPLIPKFMPEVLKIARMATEEVHNSLDEGVNYETSSILLRSALLALKDIVKAIPLFVTSYVTECISLITKVEFASDEVLSRSVREFSNTLGVTITHHSLFPLISKSAKGAIAKGPSCFTLLLKLLDTSTQATASSAILDMRDEWMKFLVILFDYRCYVEAELNDVFKTKCSWKLKQLKRKSSTPSGYTQ
jgi:U3 small nucleolar RNA-associated protein 10